MQTSIGYEATFINQSPVSSIGLELGLLYARTYYLGLYGYSGFLNNGYQDVTSFDSIAVVNDGGMRLGYNIKPHKAVHVNTSVKIGLLGINVINPQGISTFPSTLSITPSVEVELNLTRWLKLGLSAGWRWANKSTDFFKENKVNSLAYGFVFRVGRFAR